MRTTKINVVTNRAAATTPVMITCNGVSDAAASLWSPFLRIPTKADSTVTTFLTNPAI